MATIVTSWKEIETVLPGMKTLWKAIKAETGSHARSPKHVTLSDEPMQMHPNDWSCCRRFSVDLATMAIVGTVHVSAGEWACVANNPDKAVRGVPDGAALVDCEWSDFHHYFHVRVQVKTGSIQAKVLGA